MTEPTQTIFRKADVRKNVTSENGQKRELVVTASHHFSHKRMQIGRKFKELSAPSGVKQKEVNLTQVSIKEINIH